MAAQDASVAIRNALQKLDQPPNSLHKVEKLESVKSKLRRWGSHLNRFTSIPDLTQVREIAYDVEDAMDNAVMVDAAASSSSAAHQRWRKMGNSFLFFSRAHKISQQHLEEQIDNIDKRTTYIGRSANFDDDDDDEEAVVEDQDLAIFYHSLSGFPEDAYISARQLIQIWVAEGFLDPQGSITMEEQGREQIDWLLNRGFITQVETGTRGILKTFKISEEKLLACRSAAELADFLHVKIINTGGEIGGIISKLETTRLAIHKQSTGDPLTGNDLRSFANLSKVRSLQIHCASSSSSSTDDVNEDYGFLKPRKNEFGSLWVLDLGCLAIETVPEVIGKLAHLRYLRLRASKATKIPASICNLQSLQTIDLVETKRVKTMPAEIWKMKKNLRHLHLGCGAGTAFPPPRRANHYDALENLQTLCGVRPDKELKRLMVRAKFPNVTRLRVQINKDSPANKEEFFSFLNSLDHLYHLRSLTLGGPIERLPDWNAFPSSLTKMTLSKTRIPAANCVKTLENLPNLTYLKLMEESVAGTELKCAGSGFPALQVLRMEGLKDLNSWRVEKGAMRFLRDLEVKECQGLKTLEVFQPSNELRKTLQKMDHPPGNGITINVYPPPPAKSNDAE